LENYEFFANYLYLKVVQEDEILND